MTRDMSDEAARWTARMDAGGWSAQDESELQSWLAAHPMHGGALLQAQAAWISTEPGAAEEARGRASPNRVSRRGIVTFGGGLIAASLAGGLIWGTSSLHYATGVGEIRRVPLADGSVAAINTASRIAIHVDAKRRNVKLEAGEAWFQVAKDPERPFVVDAGRVRVRAVGTAFAVRLRSNGAQVFVTEGVVEAWVEGAEGHRVRIAAGGKAFVSNDAAIKVAATEPSAVDRSLAWRAGKIDLDGNRLDFAVGEFNRYNARKLIIVDPALGSEAFDGIFRVDDPEGFALAVRDSLGIPVDAEHPDGIRIGKLPN
ncbi:FecR family protein [Sphingomonas koreensis]